MADYTGPPPGGIIKAYSDRPGVIFYQQEKGENPTSLKTPGPREKEISILGLKLSYSKAFGIAFMVLFILLFFPGIGVSSSGIKEKK